MSRAVLVVMARYPAVGRVKTRLARAIGAARACALYRAFLRDLQERFADRPRHLIWAFEPPDSDFPSCVAPGSRCVPQRGADLGARMHHCFRDLRDQGFERIIMIGADVPHVRDAWLDEAEQRLGAVDVVLGPSADGGYYLIAMRAAHDLFSGIEMGTVRVLQQTLARARRLGLRVHLLPRTFDIDEARDLMQLRNLIASAGGDVRLPHTAAVLAELRPEGRSA